MKQAGAFIGEIFAACLSPLQLNPKKHSRNPRATRARVALRDNGESNGSNCSLATE